MVNHKDNTNSYIFYILKCKLLSSGKILTFLHKKTNIAPSKTVSGFLVGQSGGANN